MVIITVAGATQATEIPISYLDLRYANVIEQSTEYTCGAAAVATLLTYFYGIPTTERDVLNLISEATPVRGEKPDQEKGLTAYDLKEALEAKGIPTRGFLVKPAALQDYFSRGGLPVIIHLTKPEKHFEVAVGMVGDQIVIADPSWGRSVMPMNYPAASGRGIKKHCEQNAPRGGESNPKGLSLLVKQRGYDGVVLVPIPSSLLARQVAARQRKTSVWAAFRLTKLAQLRESLP